MILGDVEETVTTIEIDEETYEEIYKVRTKKVVYLLSQIFFLKPHCVILLKQFIADCFLSQALTQVLDKSLWKNTGYLETWC